ncbi:hypothetical protein B0H13DRAFT_1883773 [Mycena leptocephala]|nr:hypothetical protein B0H13DRAFT_1883773 [Mycena leptocephala]
MAGSLHIRSAAPSDIPALAEITISAANYTIPGRKLGDELFDLERDIAPGEPGGSPPGTLRLQFEDWLSKGHIWLAELEGRVVGSTAWYRPIWDASMAHLYISLASYRPPPSITVSSDPRLVYVYAYAYANVNVLALV